MQRSTFIAISLASALAAAPAFAQTNTTPSTNPPPAATTGGPTMTHPAADQWLVSHLKGLEVYNDQNQRLGGIDELIANQQGQIQSAVLDVGGFLGVGVKHVAVPFNQLHFVDTVVPVAGANRAVPPANPATSPAGAGLATNPVGAPNASANQTGAGSLAASRVRMPNVPDHAVLNMTQDQLKNAATFDYNK